MSVWIYIKPTAFDELMKFVKKQCTKGLTPVYGLEDTGGNGIALAVHLVENNQVNSALSYNERMSNATTQKSDSWGWDAFCIAKHASGLKNQMDQQLSDHYP